MKCSVQGCVKEVVAKDFCSTHYKRFSRHGHVLFTRQSDWGSRTKHPLYKLHHGLVRSYTAHQMLDKRWLDFWDFVKDVGDKPEGDWRLSRKDETIAYGPDNWHWIKAKEFGDARYKEYRKLWQKRKRDTDPEYSFNASLKKSYGICCNTYYKMHEQQNGVCAICEKAELSVDKNTGKIRRLSVDHCHTTGKIRGLLCSRCNRGLGFFRDNVDLLRNAIQYLTE